MRTRKSPPYLLTVLTGPNAGAELGLSGARKTLGSDPKQDIQLDDLPDQALRLMMDKGALRVRPSRDVDVKLRDGTALKPARTTTLPLPVQLTVEGSVSLHLCQTRPMKTSLTHRFRVLTAAACVVCFGGFGVATLVSSSGLATASVSSQPVVPQVNAVAAGPAAPARQGCGSECMEQAASTFRNAIEEAGIAGVTVSPGADILRVIAPPDVASHPRWSSIRRDYDKAWGARAPLLVEQSRPITKAPFAVQSVWLGKPAEVTTRDGQTYRVGSTVPGGFVVEAIRSGSVDLISGRDRVRIEF